jgi:HD-GYP domain-containing protein (c-di-GMP phosphodiesterase class II)
MPRWAASARRLLHDIGRWASRQILLKPGPLTDDEWVLMRKHPVYAYEMLSPIIYLKPLKYPLLHQRNGTARAIHMD